MAKHSVSLERLAHRLRALDEDALAEVSDFVEFLCQKQEKKDQGLLGFLQERALPSVTLEQARSSLLTFATTLTAAGN